MADSAPVDDQNLWRSVYTTEGGWGPDVAFAAHKSLAAPAVAGMNGQLVCVHRGARPTGGSDPFAEYRMPLRWTSHIPASSVPFAEKVAQLTAGTSRSDADAPALSQEKAAELEAAAAAYEQSRKWVPDADVPGMLTYQTPALTVHEGAVSCVFTTWVSGQGYYLNETRLKPSGSEWTTPQGIDLREVQKVVAQQQREARYGTGTSPMLIPSAPALVSYAGKRHLLWVDTRSRQIFHMVHDGTWKVLREAGGEDSEYGEQPKAVATPASGWGSTGGNPNLSLAVHGTDLHLVYRKSHDDAQLWHAVFNGTAWSEAAAVTGHTSRRNAALASYDGRLHAVYPAADTEQLVHAVYENGVWGKPKPLEGHNSKNTPALLTFKESPEGDEALLLVHRGVDRYVPPVPKPYVAPKIKNTIATSTARMTDYATGAWGKAHHQLTVSSVVFDDGSKGVTARLYGEFYYYWGFGYYSDTGTLTGRLKIRKDNGYIYEQSFSADINGSCDVTLQWPNLEPGNYQVWIAGGTSKRGGYWFGHRDDLTYKNGIWSEIELHPIGTSVNVPS